MTMDKDITRDEFRDRFLEKSINCCNFGSRHPRKAQQVLKESYVSMDYYAISVACPRACPRAQLHGPFETITSSKKNDHAI